MSVTIQITSLGGVDCEAEHGPSGAKLKTTAPKDNGGDGSSFSPTDLVATALGSCVLTILSMVAKRKDIDVTGATATVTKHMSTDAPRRIVGLPVEVHVPVDVPEEHRPLLERAAHGCPVHATLGDRVDAPITFTWG